MNYLVQAPANTLTYYIAGYTVFFSVMILYLVSLWLRKRNLQRDLELMEELEKKE